MRDFDWEIIDELYRNPNVSRAAAVLYMTQPTLTKRLQHIERELGVSIAERTPKGLVFTPEGTYLAQRAAEHKEFVERTKRALADLERERRRTIRIGSSYTFNKYSLWGVLGGYTEFGDPEVHFDVVNEQSDTLFRKLLDGEVDIVFVRGDFEGPVHRILVDCNQAYLVSRDPLDIDDLPRLDRIDFRTNEQSTQLLSAWWHERFGVDMTPGRNVGYIDFTWELVAQGKGYALSFVPENFRNSRDLHLAPLFHRDGLPLVRRTWCLYLSGASLPAHMREFIAYVEQHVAIAPDVIRQPCCLHS